MRPIILLKLSVVGDASESLDATNSTSRLDVADDRPAHWNRLRPAPARTSARRSGVAVTSSRVAPAPRPARVIQIPKPKALPAPTVTPAAVDSIPSLVSFKPSWMTSSRGAVQVTGSGTRGVGAARGGGTLTGRTTASAASATLAMEDIQDDTVSPVRSLATPGRSNGLQLSVGASQLADSPADAFAETNGDRGDSFTRHTLHTFDATPGALESQYLSPEHTHSTLRHEYGIDSGERGPFSSGLHRSTSSRGSKARPGSLKAKLQKIQRDGDAAENRIANVPVEKNSRAVDLQDPRQRAVRYVDAEVTAVLEDRAPFKVVRMEVTGNRSKACDVGGAPGHHEATVGSELLGYFKPDTCTGLGRSLGVGLQIRVYDAFVVKVGADFCLLCTGCWEPVGHG
jgi:hypothetical protein